MMVRERVIIVFLMAAIITTLGLGAAVAYSFAHPSSGHVAQGMVTPGTGSANDSLTAWPPGASATSGAGASSSRTLEGAGAGSSATVASPGAAAGSSAGRGVGPPPQPRGGSGVSAGVITVGAIYDETGPLDGSVARDTVRAYFDKVNEEGGVNGLRLRLIDCDSGFDPTRGHECSERLVDAGALAVVGWLSPSSEQTETSVLAQRGIPVIGGLGVPAEFQSPLSFPVTGSPVELMDGFAAHAVDLDLHAPAVVILNVPFIAPVAQAMLNSLHRHGIHEKSVDFVDATKPDYTDLAVKIRLEGADSIIAAIDPFSYARFFQALDRQNYHPPFLGFALDNKSAERQYGTAVFNAESATPFLEPDEHMNAPAMAEYYSTVRRYFPNQVESLDVLSEGAWVAAKLFVEALRRLGSAPVTSGSLVASLDRITRWDDGGFTVPLSYAPGTHDPNHCLQWIRNLHGKWHTYSGWHCA